MRCERTPPRLLSITEERVGERGRIDCTYPPALLTAFLFRWAAAEVLPRPLLYVHIWQDTGTRMSCRKILWLWFTFLRREQQDETWNKVSGERMFY
ncbi:hypothetical protein MATL_G00225280 [Megalops atlanticus]|uniref:Uncharacterized protein n=1 Tax=Megalops atlanticus TaxID=7932 RepID=A0A9D3PJS3_MEGAT|nr:hypothetical protein MATL_G00225280 [Megalops atlanticus]